MRKSRDHRLAPPARSIPFHLADAAGPIDGCYDLACPSMLDDMADPVGVRRRAAGGEVFVVDERAEDRRPG